MTKIVIDPEASNQQGENGMYKKGYNDFPDILKDEIIRKQFKEIIDCINDGIFITDGEGNILILNKASAELCRYDEDYLTGKNMEMLVDTGVFEDSAAMEAIKKQRMVSFLQKGLTENKDILVTGVPFMKNGRVELVLVTERDVTELLRMRSILENNEDRFRDDVRIFICKVTIGEQMVSDSSEMEKIMKLMSRLSGTDATVLIEGETGTGKSFIAKHLFGQSVRRDKPFVEINCSAIPDTLLESELFGYERGSFTGASKEGKKGLFEIANGGTLFLDEIGEIPFPMQAKILRAVQEKEIMRIGGTENIPVDVRIIAATNRNLGDMVHDGTFRRDLFYRLNVFKIKVPPLRNRSEDMISLCNTFLEKFNKKYSAEKQISTSAIKALMKHSWPGNIRELENLIERAVVISDSDIIGRTDIVDLFDEDESVVSAGKYESYDNPGHLDLRKELAAIEADIIRAKAQHCQTELQLAGILSVDNSTVSRKLKKYGIALPGKNTYK